MSSGVKLLYVKFHMWNFIPRGGWPGGEIGGEFEIHLWDPIISRPGGEIPGVEFHHFTISPSGGGGIGRETFT